MGCNSAVHFLKLQSLILFSPTTYPVVISPSEICNKAQRIYPQAISAWIAGNQLELYPWRIPANLKLSERHSENVHNVLALRLSAKESIGFGYTVEWEKRNSRKHGENEFFPIAIYIDSFHDLIKLISKKREFKALEQRVEKIRANLPELESWLHNSWPQLIDLDAIDDLVTVAKYLKLNPRPECFARELPLAVPTKLIKNHRPLLTEWLDILLPDETIDCSCDPKRFEQRYGFLAFRKHILTRILDPELQSELRLFTAELSLPPQEIARLPIKNARVVMVENHVTLLTLPPIERGIAFFGMGMGITQLFDIRWLHDTSISYWGDLDVQGFEILAMLRRHYPNTRSILMDMETILAFHHLATNGTGHMPETPSELSEAEAEAFLYLRANNLRIEQEHILQRRVNESVSRL